jgi:hypothetical protein
MSSGLPGLCAQTLDDMSQFSNGDGNVKGVVS